MNLQKLKKLNEEIKSLLHEKLVETEYVVISDVKLIINNVVKELPFIDIPYIQKDRFNRDELIQVVIDYLYDNQIWDKDSFVDFDEPRPMITVDNGKVTLDFGKLAMDAQNKISNIDIEQEQILGDIVVTLFCLIRKDTPLQQI